MVSQEELERMSPEEIAELQRAQCIFCRIERGEIPSHFVLKGDISIGILDINPAQKGHVLLYPKDHVPVLPLLPKAVLDPFWHDAQSVSRGIREGALSRGVQVFIANGLAAGQQSPHCIAHLIPYDDRPHVFIPERQIDGQEELAVKLKQRLGIREQKPVNKMDLVAAFLQSNDAARKLLIEDPDKAAALILQDEEARVLFDGVDLKKLGMELRRMSN